MSNIVRDKEYSPKTVNTEPIVNEIKNNTNEFNDKTLLELQVFDKILNNFNTNTVTNTNDCHDFNEIESIIDDIDKEIGSKSIEIEIFYPPHMKHEQTLQNNIASVENIAGLVELDDKIIEKKYNLETNNNTTFDDILKMKTVECDASNIPFASNSFKTNSTHLSEHKFVSVNKNKELGNINFMHDRIDMNLDCMEDDKNKAGVEYSESNDQSNTWFEYSCRTHIYNSNNTRTAIKQSSQNRGTIENIIDLCDSDNSSDVEFIDEDKARKCVIIKNMHKNKQENEGNDDCNSSDVEIIEETQSKEGIDFETKHEHCSANSEKEEIHVKLNSEYFDSDNSDGYNSSDFEFIDEDEAKTNVFFTNILTQNSSDDNILTDTAIFREFCEESLIDDYFNSLIPRNKKEENVIPNGDEYFDLFIENSARMPSIQMENKSICRLSTMHVEMEAFRMIPRAFEKDPELQDEAADCAKAIRSMYPGENRRRTY